MIVIKFYEVITVLVIFVLSAGSRVRRRLRRNFPDTIWLDRYLLSRSSGGLKYLLDVFIYGKTVECDDLITDWTSPCGCLFLKFQEHESIEALVVVTGGGAARIFEP